MEWCRASAPGKVILFGEHAVVHGVAALASCVNLRTTATVTEDPNGLRNITVCIPEIHEKEVVLDEDEVAQCFNISPVLEGAPDEMATKERSKKALVVGTLKALCSEVLGSDCEDRVLVALAALLYLYHEIVPATRRGQGVMVTVNSTLPIGAGLGSSASFSVALATAFLGSSHQISGQSPLSDESLNLINEWAFEAERIIHGDPSGIDNTVSTFGGAILYRRGGEVVKLQNTLPRHTKVLVAGVRELKEQLPQVVRDLAGQRQRLLGKADTRPQVDPLFRSIEAIVSKCKDLLTSPEISVTEREKEFAKLLSVNHGILNAIGVGHERLDEIVHMAKQFGYSCKLTGAGGGGCAIAFVESDTPDSKVQEFIEQVKSNGWKCYDVQINGQGAAVECKDRDECEASVKKQ